MHREPQYLEVLLEDLQKICLTESARALPYITDEPKIPSYVCFASLQAKNTYEVTKEIYGQGYNMSDTLARIKSVAECLERLCSFNPDISKLIPLSFDSGSIIDPAHFCSYSNRQLKDKGDFLRQCREETYLCWPVLDLKTNTQTYIPAQMVFLSNHFNHEFPIRGERISTGTAFGKVGERRALEAGFFEVIERDSCIPAYLLQKKLRLITEVPSEVRDLIEYVQRYRLEPYLLDCTSDLEIPSVVSIIIDRTGIGDAVNVGAKSSRTYLEALTGALFESLQCRRGSRIHKGFEELIPTLNPRDIHTMEERFKYWGDSHMIATVERWLEKTEPISYSKLCALNCSFDQAITRVIDRGFSIYVADLTVPEIADNGFETLKIIMPDMHPLYIDEDAKCLYSRHYGEIYPEQGLPPHPFT